MFNRDDNIDFQHGTRLDLPRDHCHSLIEALGKRRAFMERTTNRPFVAWLSRCTSGAVSAIKPIPINRDFVVFARRKNCSLSGRVFTEGKRTLHFAWMLVLDCQTANHVSRRQHNNVAKEGRRLMEGILVLLAALFLTGQVIAASRGLTKRMRRHKRLRENALRRPRERSD